MSPPFRSGGGSAYCAARGEPDAHRGQRADAEERTLSGPPAGTGGAGDARSREPTLLLALGAGALLVSGIAPWDRLTWVLEVTPAVVAAAILVATRRRFPLTPLAYRLVLLHALILMLGGHYSYARVPIGFWAQDLFELSRNHYDRVGHFAQGFVPAIVVREVLVRASPVRSGRWLAFLTLSVVLAASAFYEFIEWWASLIGGYAAEAFLATQGDVWDTQWDMFLCLCGAVLSLALLSRRHDRELTRTRAA